MIEWKYLVVIGLIAIASSGALIMGATAPSIQDEEPATTIAPDTVTVEDEGEIREAKVSNDLTQEETEGLL